MTIRVIAISCFFLSVLSPGPTFAQDRDDLVQVVTVSVRPGGNMQFEEYARAVREAAVRRDYEYFWFADQAVSGEPVYTFAIQRGGWAGGIVDPPAELLVDAFGEEEAARLEELARSSVESVHTAFYTRRPDLSVEPPDSARTPDAVVFNDITLNPGMLGQYVDMSQKTRVASAAVFPDAYYIVQLPGYGATGPRVVSVIPSWRDLDTPRPGPGQRVIQHYGPEEGGDLNAMAIEVISNIQVVLNRTRPDLSYRPGD